MLPKETYRTEEGSSHLRQSRSSSQRLIEMFTEEALAWRKSRKKIGPTVRTGHPLESPVTAPGPSSSSNVLTSM
ncbi:hypothetical protein SUGI_1063900 [Cryptomeria japonica]|nr:hypothetical protein SUGI_1063900 [Cryptomeria japonica]